MLCVKKISLLILLVAMLSMTVFANNETVDSILTLYGNYPTTTVILEEMGYGADDNSISLVANATRPVICHGVANDLDGTTNMYDVNATIFGTNSDQGSAENESVHYTNTSCYYDFVSGVQEWNCTFDVHYFAENSTWTCSVNISDTDGFTNESINDTAVIEDLISLDVHNATVDFGNRIVGTDYAPDTEVLVFNTGNVVLDLALDAFNQTATYEDDNNQAFNCTIGEIPVGNLKYSLTGGEGSYAAVAAGNTMLDVGARTGIPFQLGHQEGTDGLPGNTFLPTSQTNWWAISVPYSIAGTCTGRLMYIAEAGN